MGDPRKPRKKYSTPSHPWEKDRIDEEKKIMKEYGLKNKKEIWKMNSILKSLKDMVKKTSTLRTKQMQTERSHVINKAKRFKMINREAGADNILSLEVKDILERRLQTVVFRKGMANSMIQARKFITHGHISVDNKVIKIPSHLVSDEEEEKIAYSTTSPLRDENHVMRQEIAKPKKEKKKIKKEKKARWERRR